MKPIWCVWGAQVMSSIPASFIFQNTGHQKFHVPDLCQFYDTTSLDWWMDFMIGESMRVCAHVCDQFNEAATRST